MCILQLYNFCIQLYIISFSFAQIDEAGERSSKDGVGFITKHFEQSEEFLAFSPHSAVLNTKGNIHINGTVMTTKLPPLKRGSDITFQCNRIVPGKLRVTISVEDKEVTFDFTTVDEEDEAEDDDDFENVLDFACGFEHTGWQITVK